MLSKSEHYFHDFARQSRRLSSFNPSVPLSSNPFLNLRSEVLRRQPSNRSGGGSYV